MSTCFEGREIWATPGGAESLFLTLHSVTSAAWGLEDSIGCWRLHWGWLHARKMPYLTVLSLALEISIFSI